MNDSKLSEIKEKIKEDLGLVKIFLMNLESLQIQSGSAINKDNKVDLIINGAEVFQLS